MKVGRRPKLCPEVQRRLCEAIVGGNTRETAARYAGVTYSTLHHWLTRGRKASRGRFRQLLEAVKKAENDAVVRNVAIINKAAQKTWTAAAWWLERRRPDDWARKDVTKIVGAGKGGEIVVVTLGPGQSMGDL
jgi:hypothetical protein